MAAAVESVLARVDRLPAAVATSRREIRVGDAEASDEELMRAYVTGQAQAFSLLFRRLAPLLLRIAERQLGRGADAQDVVQQTFLQVHRARGDFDGHMKVRPWIVTITMNLARDLLRRRGRWRESDVDDLPLVAPDVTGGAREQADEQARVRAALARLAPEQREVIVLHWFEDMPFNEIAQVVGTTPAAARVRAHRGYERLRKLLGEGNVPAEKDVE
jgi:RNA polymerase sigma-70 factor (ECF subfamily)